jgi:hypothetical protein
MIGRSQPAQWIDRSREVKRLSRNQAVEAIVRSVDYAASRPGRMPRGSAGRAYSVGAPMTMNPSTMVGNTNRSQGGAMWLS